ncbi:hypothetical protein Afil01_44280 [Actinorhabdospora filicis]|uniref:Uncharacterized protein n=1 Tax=Actinorhabdospora filicis TaxID=1785913 RepID=A0A9W6SP82_9ACTN|nr:hypothetical protein [Actinorhabdospora filicis]GLZ79621.1 hypothetical protein Afil01_44280 [Actinorhabdospora filicis]
MKFAENEWTAAAKAALIEINIAAVILRTDPKVWRIAEIVYGGQCNPVEVKETGEKWGEFSDKLGETIAAIDAILADQLVRGWTGADQEAFVTHMAKVRTALTAVRVLAGVMALAMTITGGLLYFLIVAMTVVSSVLAALAVASLFPPWRLVLAPTVTMVSTAGYTALKQLTTAIEMTGNAFAAMITGAAVIDIGIQLAGGNTDVFASLGEGLKGSLLDILKGGLGLGEQLGFGKLMHKGFPLGMVGLLGADISNLFVPNDEGSEDPEDDHAGLGGITGWIWDKSYEGINGEKEEEEPISW